MKAPSDCTVGTPPPCSFNYKSVSIGLLRNQIVAVIDKEDPILVMEVRDLKNQVLIDYNSENILSDAPQINNQQILLFSPNGEIANKIKVGMTIVFHMRKKSWKESLLLTLEVSKDYS